MSDFTNKKSLMTYPVVSVIVPVYNSEPYLEDCLNSIVHQTYQSIEIILINDGSTDRSHEIMNNYSMRDKRIVLLSQSNKGVSAARNAGLSIATGEYVLFVDSDDTIRNDAVEILCQQAILTNAEIVMGNIYFCYPDGNQIPCYQRITELNKHQLLSGEECFSQLTETYIFPPLVCLYFTKLSFIRKRQLLFEEGIIHEDELWCVKTLIYAPKVSVMDFFYYFYRIREGSIMRSDNKKYRVNSFFKVVKALEAFAAELQEKQEFTKSVGYIYFRIFCIYRLSICQLLLEMNDGTNEYKDYFGKLLKKIYPTLSRLQQKACYTLFRNGNRLLFGLTLSFCITCRNQFYQIKQTFPKNLEDNRESKNIIEFILVDFGSTDGLRKWIVENFMNEINDGYLKYYYTEELSSWHTSIAKNTSHKLANNDIVVNLDCKNFTGKNGGQLVIDYMTKYDCEKMILYQSGNEYRDGSYGCIALSKNNFLKLGGYDECFESTDYQDEDLLLRAQKMGLSCIDLTNTRYCSTMINEEKIVNLSLKEMIEHNFQLSAKIITAENIKANMDKDHIGIVDNIYTL